MLNFANQLAIIFIMLQTFLFIGFPEIVTVLIIAVMLFGSDKLPEIARTFGKTVRQMRDASDDIKREIMKPVDDIKDDVKQGIEEGVGENEELSSFQKVQKEISEAREEIEEFTRGPIKRDS